MANLDQAALLDLAQRYLYPNYRQPPCVFVRGRGCEVWDKAGKRYLDLAAGVAVSSVGHAHPRYVAAISEQAGRLVHMSNYFYNEPNDPPRGRALPSHRDGQGFSLQFGD